MSRGLVVNGRSRQLVPLFSRDPQPLHAPAMLGFDFYGRRQCFVSTSCTRCVPTGFGGEDKYSDGAQTCVRFVQALSAFVLSDGRSAG